MRSSSVRASPLESAESAGVRRSPPSPCEYERVRRRRVREAFDIHRLARMSSPLVACNTDPTPVEKDQQICGRLAAPRFASNADNENGGVTKAHRGRFDTFAWRIVSYPALFPTPPSSWCERRYPLLPICSWHRLPSVFWIRLSDRSALWGRRATRRASWLPRTPMALRWRSWTRHLRAPGAVAAASRAKSARAGQRQHRVKPDVVEIHQIDPRWEEEAPVGGGIVPLES